MEKEAGVKKVAVAVAAPEEATLTLTAPLPAPEKEPETQDKCYKKTVGEEATFLETAKDYFNQFKEIPAKKHWICLKSYFNQKCGSVFGKEKIEPLKDETTEVAAEPAAAPVNLTEGVPVVFQQENQNVNNPWVFCGGEDLRLLWSPKVVS